MWNLGFDVSDFVREKKEAKKKQIVAKEVRESNQTAENIKKKNEQTAQSLYDTMSQEWSWEALEYMIDYYQENNVFPTQEKISGVPMSSDVFGKIQQYLTNSVYLSNKDVGKKLIIGWIIQQVEQPAFDDLQQIMLLEDQEHHTLDRGE